MLKKIHIFLNTFKRLIGMTMKGKMNQTHLPTQTHPFKYDPNHQIINWVKWVSTQLNPTNINVYWV